MKIYTKKGDRGETYLFGGGPFPKDDARVAAYGTVDELNAVLGCALAELGESHEFAIRLLDIQKELFVVGAELATINPSTEMQKGFLHARSSESLERDIDAWEAQLPPLKKFILPGGSKPAAALHLARTVCRRAERALVGVGRAQTIRPELIVYLNRLSDWLFVLSRLVNQRSQRLDILWEGILGK